MDRFVNAILFTKTSTDKGKIEILRVVVGSCRSEGSRECKLFDFWEKVVFSICVVIKIFRNRKIQLSLGG